VAPDRESRSSSLLAAWSGDVSLGSEAADAIVRRGAGNRVVDVEVMVRGEPGVEFDAQQPALAVRVDVQMDERRAQ
jgi:hypothetical protein